MELAYLNRDNFEDFFALRAAFMKELGEIDDNTDLKELLEVSCEYYHENINKDFIAIGVMDNGQLIAVGAVCVYRRFPYTVNLSGTEGYVFNIYTKPAFRKKGACEMIVRALIAYAKENNIEKLSLAASDEGRGIYRKCGFSDNKHGMQWYLQENNA